MTMNNELALAQDMLDRIRIPEEVSKRDEETLVVLSLMVDGRERTVSDVMNQTGFVQQKASNALNRLKRMGMVAEQGRVLGYKIWRSANVQ